MKLWSIDTRPNSNNNIYTPVLLYPLYDVVKIITWAGIPGRDFSPYTTMIPGSWKMTETLCVVLLICALCHSRIREQMTKEERSSCLLKEGSRRWGGRGMVCENLTERANQLNQKRRGFRDNTVRSLLSVTERSQKELTSAEPHLPKPSLIFPCRSDNWINSLKNSTDCIFCISLSRPKWAIWSQFHLMWFCGFSLPSSCPCVRPTPRTRNTGARSNTGSRVHACYTRHRKQITSLGIPHEIMQD